MCVCVCVCVCAALNGTLERLLSRLALLCALHTRHSRIRPQRPLYRRVSYLLARSLQRQDTWDLSQRASCPISHSIATRYEVIA